MTAPGPENAGRDPTRNCPTIWADIHGMLRVFGGIFIPYMPYWDTRYLAYDLLHGHVKLIKNGVNSYLRFKDDSSYGCRKIWMIPSSGLIDNGASLPASLADSDVYTAGIRVWNTDVSQALEFKFTPSNSDVEWVGMEITETTIKTIIRDAEWNTLASGETALSTWADLNAMAAAAGAGGWDGAVVANGTWNCNLTSGDGTISSSALVPSGDYLYIPDDSFTDFYEDSSRSATVEITSGPQPDAKTLTLRYDDGGGGGVATTAYNLKYGATVDTLGELETVVEGLGDNWEIQVEGGTDSASVNLGLLSETSVLGVGRLKNILMVSTPTVMKTHIQPTDQIHIYDTNSPANGRVLVVGDYIDLANGYAEIIGGVPGDKVLFGPTATEIVAKVVRASNCFMDKGAPIIWRTNTPNPGSDTVATEYSPICKFWQRSDMNIRHTGGGADDWTANELAEDYSNYRSCFTCTKLGVDNMIPGSAKDTIRDYNLGADGDTDYSGYVATGYVNLGGTMIELSGCSGGPVGSRCPHYEAQEDRYEVVDYFTYLMYGEWQTWVQDTWGLPNYTVQWRSPYSIAALVGTFPDNNTLMNTRRGIYHVSGQVGAVEYTDFANDGSFQKLFSRSRTDQDETIAGQCELLLGDARTVERHARWFRLHRGLETGVQEQFSSNE
jgi:hypothetical protein